MASRLLSSTDDDPLGRVQLRFLGPSREHMYRFAANLSLMYTEVSFLDRFAAAALDGFTAVEYLFPYEHPAPAISARLKEHGLTQALFNLPPGRWDAGDRGMACQPGREAEFAATVELALSYARATDCQRLHVMAGIVPAGVPTEQARATFVANLRQAAMRVAPWGIALMIEPINTRDMPGYFLNYQQQAHDILAEIGEPNLRVQMDWYHCQIMEGDLCRRLEKHIASVGHIQIAGVPNRQEPDEGEVNFSYLLDRLDALGYEGFVGCEYRPRAGTTEGLDWLRKLRKE